MKLQLQKSRALAAAILLASTGGSSLFAAELKPETIRAWSAYIEATEARITAELAPEGAFLVQENSPRLDARETILAGRVYVEKMETRNVEGKKIPIPGGRIHHWLGSVLIRNVELSEVLGWLRDCSNFENHFEGVERSRNLSVQGDVIECFLRVRGKKVRTVHYDTEQTIRYSTVGAGRAASRTEATRIVQLKDPGSPKESEMPEGRDSGYLWRWNSYWRFKAEGNQVIVECESISLSRSVPKAFWWIVKPFLSSLPKEYLQSTLASLRDAIEAAAHPPTD
ncbi:MAG TPA: hypothetical protein VIE88_14120 [Vicinamibacteria bacterium]